MFTPSSVVKKFAIGALITVASGAAWPVWAQSNDRDLIDNKYFYTNMIQYMAACDGEPTFIPLSVRSPVFISVYLQDVGSVNRKVTWIEDNCAFLIRPGNRLDKVIPASNGFEANAVTTNYLLDVSVWLDRRSLPSKLSDLLLIQDAVQKIYYYTDLDVSGAFEPSERLNTDDLYSEQIQWFFSKKELLTNPFVDPFGHLGSYETTGGTFVQVGKFVSGPLSGRGLFIIASLVGDIIND